MKPRFVSSWMMWPMFVALACGGATAPKGEAPTPASKAPTTEPAKAEVAAPVEPAKTDAPAPVEPATEPAKVEPAKTEPAKVEPAKTEPAKTEPAPAPAPGTLKVGKWKLTSATWSDGGAVPLTQAHVTSIGSCLRTVKPKRAEVVASVAADALTKVEVKGVSLKCVDELRGTRVPGLGRDGEFTAVFNQ